MQNETPQLSPQPISPTPPDMPPTPTTPKMNNKMLIIIGAVIAALLLIGGDLWLWAGSAKGDFSKNLTTYQQKAKEAYEYYRDTKQPSSHIDDITNKFTAALNAKPQAPQLLGIQLADAADLQKANTLTAALTSLRDDFTMYHAFDDYGKSVITIMNQHAVSISTPADMQKAKLRFNDAVVQLKALNTPNNARSFQTAIEKAYTDMVSDIDTALIALDGGDSGGYSKAIAKLSADSRGASGTKAANDLNKLSDDLYNDLVKVYNDLATAVGES